jgi:hypothetical protein
MASTSASATVPLGTSSTAPTPPIGIAGQQPVSSLPVAVTTPPATSGARSAPPPEFSSTAAGTSIYTAPLVTMTSEGYSAPALASQSPYSMMPYGYPPYSGGYPPMPAGLGYPPPAPSSLSAASSIINITSSITIRLTSENYLFWKAQVGPLLRSNLLMGYVDGSLVCPPAHTIIDHGGVAVPQPNPAYQHWI